MTGSRDEVTAVVLVGGGSVRMGRDKATLVPDDGDPRALAQRVLDTLSTVARHSLLAGPALPGLDHVPAVPDRNTTAGPLAGVTAALAVVRTPLAVVAACDMPSIVPALVADLLHRARANPQALCVLCATEQGPEPLLSVWRPAAAELLDAALDAGVRALRDAVARLPHVLLTLAEWRVLDPAGASFANWNFPTDLPRS